MPRELTDQTLQVLHDLSWSCYRLQTYMTLAMCVQQDQVKNVNSTLALELLLQDADALMEDIMNMLDDLQEKLGITFPRDGWRELEAPAGAEHAE